MPVISNQPQQNSGGAAGVAFSPLCPSTDEVTGVLRKLGFRLTFQMGEVVYCPSLQVPPLPAQFHYCDQHNTEVIYLAGCDVDLDGAHLPPHASRFWIYRGANLEAYQRALQSITAQWALTWQ